MGNPSAIEAIATIYGMRHGVYVPGLQRSVTCEAAQTETQSVAIDRFGAAAQR